jgi:predicted metalloprotease with PDZ domain
MRERAAKLGPRAPKSPQLFEATIRSFGLDVRPDIARVLDAGAAALLPANAFGGCVRVTTREAPRFALGYSLERRDGVQVLAKVDPAGPAYAAGLREGITYIRRLSGVRDNPAEAWTLRVSEGGHERDMSYPPIGQGSETLQQL